MPPDTLSLRAYTQPRTDAAPSAEPTVCQVLDWYQRHGVRANTSLVALRERQRIWTLFTDRLGHLPCSDCRPFQLLEFLDGNEGARAANTRRRWVTTLQRPFNRAVEVGYINRNPFAGLRMPKGAEGRDWTDEEYQRILRSCDADLRRLVVFIRFSGVRQQELRELEWQHINVDANVIILDKHKTAWTGTGPRLVQLNSVLVKLLLWILRRQRGNQRYVFLNSRGRPWKTSALTKRLRDLRERIGLPSAVKWHGGRHMFGTRALVNGVDLATLAELMGHRDIGTTRRYIHLSKQKDHLARAAEQAIGKRRQ